MLASEPRLCFVPADLRRPVPTPRSEWVVHGQAHSSAGQGTPGPGVWGSLGLQVWPCPLTVTPSEPRFPHVTWRGTAPAWLGGQAGVSVGRGLVPGAAGDSREGERVAPWQECRQEAERYVPGTGRMDVSKARPGSDPTLVPHRASHLCRREDSAPARARLREAGLQEAGGDLCPLPSTLLLLWLGFQILPERCGGGVWSERPRGPATGWLPWL